MKHKMTEILSMLLTVPFQVLRIVKRQEKQNETQDIMSLLIQAAGCTDKECAKASGERQPMEECGRTGL